MLQKVLLTIDAEEKATATDVARAISVLDATNFMSAAWNNVSVETIRNCFFRGLTPAVSSEPFLGFPSEEIPVSLTQEAYTEFVSLDDDVQTTGEQTDEELCAEVVQSSSTEVADVEEENADPSPPGNKEVLHALDVIRLSGKLEQIYQFGEGDDGQYGKKFKTTTLEKFF